MIKKIIAGLRWVMVHIVLLPVYFYRGAISPLTPASCRHIPTCSQYALDAVKIHGPFKGFWMATNRILHCHPWGTSGYDPVPPIKKTGRRGD
jgi:putative membrane protein insertion efficiency factor